MKSVKRVFSSDMRAVDVLVVNGRWVIQNTDSSSDFNDIVDQRVKKAIIDVPRPWAPNYGIGAYSFIGKKQSQFGSLYSRVANLQQHYSQSVRFAGPVAFPVFTVNFNGDAFYIVIKTASGYSKKYLLNYKKS